MSYRDTLIRASWPLAALERRTDAWRARARLALLLREHPDLELGADVRLEPGVLWRLDAQARVKIGAGSRIRRDVELKVGPGRLVIGQRVHIGPWTTIGALEDVEIGDDCLLAERVSIRDHEHAIADPDRPYAEQGDVLAPVRLGRNVWLGAGVTVVKGVTLGDGVVVGANAVVTRSFPAGSLVAGVPARVIRVLAPAEVIR